TFFTKQLLQKPFPGKAILPERTMCFFNHAKALNALLLLKTKSSIGKQERKLNRSALFTRRWLIYWVWSSARFVIKPILRFFCKLTLAAAVRVSTNRFKVWALCNKLAQVHSYDCSLPESLKR